MPGRGRGIMNANEILRRPSSVEENGSSRVKDLVSRIIAVTSPDDLEVTTLALEIKSLITEEGDLKDLVVQLCDNALNQIEITPVIGAVCGLAGLHQAGEMKLRSILLKRVQKDYSKREELEMTDRARFVASAMFLGEIFYYFKSDKGAPFKVLAEPVITYLSMILKPHLSIDPGPAINEEMIVVAKQLLQNGYILYQFVPKGLEDIVRDVTEIMIRHRLSDVSRLNLLAALGELWPRVNQSLNTRTLHASLAAKLDREDKGGSNSLQKLLNARNIDHFFPSFIKDPNA